jgi:hypothetical protein
MRRGSLTLPRAPVSGDVIIHRIVQPPPAYLLSSFEGRFQICCLSHESAVVDARRFARVKKVDAWYTTDEDTYELVANHRPTQRFRAA